MVVVLSQILTGPKNRADAFIIGELFLCEVRGSMDVARDKI